MNIPGMTSSHQIITKKCRENHGNEIAFEFAVQKLRDAYCHLVMRGIDDQTEIHLALIVQQERHRADLTKPPPGLPNPPRPEKWTECA